MGLLALLLVGGLPLIDALANQPATALWSAGAAIRLGIAVCNMLLLENLYFNTPSETRGTSICSASRWAAVPVRPRAVCRRGAVPPRLPRCCSRPRAGHHARRAADRVAAVAQPPLGRRHPRLARRGVPQRHPGRQRHLPARPRLTGEVFRRGGAEWGGVAEMSLIFAGVLAVARDCSPPAPPARASRRVAGGAFLQPPLRLPPGMDALHRRR